MSEVIILSPKSCPMCGSKKYRHFKQFSVTEWGYECGKCGLSTGKYQSKEEAIIVWNSLPRKLKWTNKKPTKIGWYWTRCDNNWLPVMTYVFDNNKAASFFPNLAVDGAVIFNVEESKYEWCGPIPEPDK